MMAVGHSLSGWCAVLVTRAALEWQGVPVPDTETTLAVAGAIAGAALAPDIDHHGSTATTTFGPLSWVVHRATVHTHHLVARATWDPGESMPGAHRGITHWWPTPLVMGTLVGASCWFSQWAAIGVLAALFTLAISGITIPEYRHQERHTDGVVIAHAFASLFPTVWMLRRMRREVRGAGTLLVLAASVGLAWLVLRHAPEFAHWMGVLMAVGMFVHIAGDAPTRSRVPGWTLRGEFRWPRALAFYAGGTFEVAAVWIPLSIVAVGAIPGVWPAVMATIERL